ncbi:MAG: HAD family hydrolase [Candidatus Marinimicrobia bacterium]|jgi:phosphoglycolate phosphatase|nr:HAD family hydrolase [Candidatus Neomarinimicrobiota bacterium]MDP6852722.1 HAD family hydrolase [Candidatus Neomarinimicrobiota bacterium]MDP6935866.1 HAD family hydrolase [Candidatus Neomarinimicrobiota bacterium]
MISTKYKHIIWDWNGTLLNDGWLFVDVMNDILDKRNMPLLTLDRYREIFGFPVKDYYIKLGFDLEAEPFEESGMEFIHAYDKRRYEASLYPEVLPLLKQLLDGGIKHSILSAQHQHFLDDLVEYYEITSYFTSVIGLDNHYATSKIENGKDYVKKLNLDPQNIVMIGDTDHDFEVAKAMGVDCILISHGHHHKYRLEATNAMVVDDFTSLSNLINQSSNPLILNGEK